MSSDKDELQKLAKEQLTDAQRQVAENVISGLSDDDKKWMVKLLIQGLKYKDERNKQWWLGAFTALILATIIFAVLWYNKCKA